MLVTLVIHPNGVEANFGQLDAESRVPSAQLERYFVRHLWLGLQETWWGVR